MAFFVYHRKSTQVIKAFNTHSSAKRSMTCMNRNANSDEYSVAEEEYYNKNIVWRKKVKNLMTGQEVEIDSNTPHCCDPSTETFWSM